MQAMQLAHCAFGAAAAAPRRAAAVPAAAAAAATAASPAAWAPRPRLARLYAAGSAAREQQRQRHRLQPLHSSAADQPQPLALSSGDDSALASSASGDSASYDAAGGSSGGEASSDGEGGVRIDLQLPRRRLLVQFTCNLCSGRSERLVNPVAWQRGMVIAKCQHCDAWHKLQDAGNLVEEIRYADLEDE